MKRQMETLIAVLHELRDGQRRLGGGSLGIIKMFQNPTIEQIEASRIQELEVSFAINQILALGVNFILSRTSRQEIVP